MAMKSQVVSWMGVSLSIVQGLLKEVQKLGGGDDEVRTLATPEGECLLAELARKLVKVVRQTFKVVVDYGRSLNDMIAAGKYDQTNEYITQENFPLKGNGRQEKEVVLFCFNRYVSSEDAIREMDEAGYRPADIVDLLALGESYPNLQMEYPIVALGSVWVDPGGHRCAPCLNSVGAIGARRDLDIDYFERDWGGRWRFAAVRK